MKYFFKKGNKINLGRKPSIETKKKMSEARKNFIKNNPNNTCFKKGQPNHWLGRKHTKEELLKMSNAKKGFHPKMEWKIGDVRVSGINNHGWKGGKFLHSAGYIESLNKKHPSNRYGYVFEHRLIIEKYIKRYLTNQEVVHHINGVKNDNRIKNLIAFSSKSAHQRFHKNPDNVGLKEIIFDGRVHT